MKIDNLIDALKLHFEDGSSEVVDALIGADGIFGFVRQHVLGLDHPATKPVPAGWSGLVNMVPYPKGVAKLGAEVLEEHRQYGWVGDGGIFIHDSIANKLVMCIGTRVDRNLSKERRKPVSRESLEEGFAPWVQGAEGDLARGMIDVSRSPYAPNIAMSIELIEFPIAPAAARSRESFRICSVGASRCPDLCRRPSMHSWRCWARNDSMARFWSRYGD